MFWAKKKELTPEEVKQLPPDVEVHLEGRDRHGELIWREGHIVQSGKQKVFVFRGDNFSMDIMHIRAYPNKRWVINGHAES